jgi:LAO/AO transport system kinase
MSRIAALCAQLLAGDRRALARALTVVEDGTDEERREVIATLHALAPRARIIGITGAPGVGKSSVADALITALRAQGRRVGVIAVDPSSPFSGGALLGDRVRMQSHHGDDGVFVRSMAARDRLGGLAAAAPAAALLLAAAGHDDVIVETVGVGQSEVDVASLADTTVLVMAPGMGDAVQAAKAGVLEVADVLVVNKADLSGAGMLESELRTMLEVGHATLPPVHDMADGTAAPDAPLWVPPIVRTVAVRGEGIDALLATIASHGAELTTLAARAAVRGGPAVTGRELRRARRWISELTLATLRARLDATERLEMLAVEVATQRMDPLRAADELLGELGLDG